MLIDTPARKYTRYGYAQLEIFGGGIAWRPYVRVRDHMDRLHIPRPTLFAEAADALREVDEVGARLH